MKHYSVLLKESIDALNLKKNGIYVDATLGGGGHSEAILLALSGGHLYGFDQDQYALATAKERLSKFNNFTAVESNFEFIEEELQKRGITEIDGVVMDLGMSSFQIDDASRGFSYMQNAKLDMRMNQSQTKTAYDIVNYASFEELVYIFEVYGEEDFARPIAKKIIELRPLETTFDLVKITDMYKYKSKSHSAKQVFQALRIATNDELGVLERTLPKLLKILKPGGVLSIITFHSLEDRIVKHFFKTNSEVHVPKGIPMLNLPTPPLRLISKKPILPSEQELAENSRSNSAKLRAAIKNEVKS
ncbi:16S rRNA (cytosine(1402)-N(4))-methyltransferase RsmH [Acholeplasma vituli]|uniref:Ribosomal RNA small subunit methyltransferase H n=1 Tax=Paracholeplasma vituli TaxID=69473 RepID=A0ABT2PWD9_9MOLU|nr:16S rRNA (cytosine(1402)-N(4))-methyltransferase RsmH [Paracholeplasma vituli]MCU0105276.1 16S rRNA (cytosine(1402)-N(4))-methyltransferase RsmH [Paracholeplasma vituli]